ncbi:hypothetical protein QFX18_13395 [Saccharophagus degradans]|uniref:hypothetical protein n=1 Tax=Saccharophagus degradans TaxID=86304 RepID=UPI0024781D2B|nr:hypothetical protein [Saccharophagus degradans]WGO97038.1 hypothetical protein QFX18_13395 [Saccharophagus degradans]
MHTKRLKFAEEQFLAAYPGGFAHPEIVAIGKKHNVNKLSDFCQEAFAKNKFKHADQILEDWIKVISRSSMISMFEKPKFKSFINTRNSDEKKTLVDGLKLALHGKHQQGFELQLELLKVDKLAKWSIISAVPAYYRLQEEIFVKPTTVKGIVNYFELEGITYKPTPSWEFYEKYRAYILEMKKHVSPSLSPNNPAFCGFLMMSLPT